MNIVKMPLTKFRLAPAHEARVNKIICVMTHNREAFYVVSPEHMAELLLAEQMIERIKQDNADIDTLF